MGLSDERSLVEVGYLSAVCSLREMHLLATIRSFLMGFKTPFKNKLDRHDVEPRLIPTNDRLGLLFVAPT